MPQLPTQFTIKSHSDWKETMGRLDGKIALISGAARGMGAAEARLFVAEGARVLVADVLDDIGRDLVAELGDRARYCHLDVRSEASWAQAVDAAERAFGQLDVLVNNAGILAWQSIEDMPLEVYRSVIEVNQVGCWLGMKAVLPAFKRRGSGAIVNISSLAGKVGLSQGSAYVASKHAVLGMTKCAAVEFGPYNVRVNAVLPGGVATQMAGRQQGQEARYGKLPIARIGTVDEVAHMVTFLASEEASYCTGGEFAVDGGMSLCARS